MSVRRDGGYLYGMRLCCLLLVLVTGCASTSERVVGWYVTRRLDSYLDLTSAQKTAARAQVDATISLVRRQELVHWVGFLREVRQGIHDGLTEASLERLQLHYDARLDQAEQLLVPRFAPLLTTLDARQLEHFVRKMREDVDAHYEDLQLPREQRAAYVEKRALEVVEDLVGDLREDQTRALRALIRRLPDERAAQYRSSLDNLSRFRALMQTKPSADSLTRALHEMWQRRYDGLGQGHGKVARRAQQRAWLLGAYQLLDAVQRRHAEQEISERIVMLKRWVLAG